MCRDFSSKNTANSSWCSFQSVIYSAHGALMFMEALLLYFYWSCDQVLLEYYFVFEFWPERYRLGFYEATFYLFDKFFISLMILSFFSLVFLYFYKDRKSFIRVSVLSLLHVLFFSLCFFIFKSLSF